MSDTPKTYQLNLGTDETAKVVYNQFEEIKKKIDKELSKLNKTAPKCKVYQVALKKFLNSDLSDGIEVSVLKELNADEVARLKAERARLDEQIKLYESKSK